MCTPLSNTVAQFRHCQNDRRPKSEMVEVSSSASRRHDTGSANNPTKFGLADWYPVHVSLERALTAGRVDPAWAEQRKAQWGEHSPLYANRVLGEFKADDEEGVILWVPKTSSVLVTWTNVFRLLKPSADDLAVYVQHPTVGNTCSAGVARWWDCIDD